MADAGTPDIAAACAGLTEGQRACLHLVRQHKTSKEIARILGISRFTVDQRVERACQVLGVQKRVEAALILEQFEGVGVSQRLVYEASDLADSLDQTLGSSATPENARRNDAGGQGGAGDTLERVAKARPEVTLGSRENGASSWLWQTFYPKGDPDDLSPKSRIKWIIQLMIQILVSILILVAIGQVLSTFAHKSWPVTNETPQQ